MARDRYYEQLEKLGEDVVRHRLANRMPIGDGSDNIPYDEAKAWLAEKVEERGKLEHRRHMILLVVAFISAVAALIAAIPVLRSWFS